MTIDLFNQFSAPKCFGISLIFIAMLFPTFLIYPSPRLLSNRQTAVQTWVSLLFTKQLLHKDPTRSHSWSIPILTIALLLIIFNLLGLLPYTFTPTTQLALDLALALPLWITTLLLGLRIQPSSTLAHILPQGSPTLLVPALVVIETISIFIRPLALSVRITANLTAGHLLITLISIVTLALTTLTPVIALLAWLLLLLLTILELAVAFIQAYVFVLLLTLYLQENI